MAIKMRRGLNKDFNPAKMTAGEWAVSTDTKYVHMCFSTGVVARMATYEAFEEDMKEIQIILATCQDIQTAVERFSTIAEQHKNQAETYSIESKSWAVGGTGSRTGEDTNNSKYFSTVSKKEADRAKEEADRASSVVGIGIATYEKAGIVKPDKESVLIKSDGQISAILRTAIVGQNSDTAPKPYYKYASCTISDNHIDHSISFKVSSTFQSKGMTTCGILSARVRSGIIPEISETNIVWEYANTGIDVNNFYIATKSDSGKIYCDLWVKIDAPYLFYHFDVISENTRTDKTGKIWDLYNINSSGYEDKIPTDFTVKSSILSRIANISSMPAPTNNLLATVSGSALDAVQGKVLDDKVTDINRKLKLESPIVLESSYTSLVIAQKAGNISTIRIGRNTNPLAVSSYLVCVLPESYRPLNSFGKMVCIGSTQPISVYFSILSTGEVSIRTFTNVPANTYAFIYEAYICI